MNDFRKLREQSGMNMTQFAEYFEISYRTMQKWQTGERKCPDYLLKLMEYKLEKEGIIDMNIVHKVEHETLEQAMKADRREPILAVKTTARTLKGIIEAIEKETDFFYGMDDEEKEEFILHADFHIYKDGVAAWEN